jgi:MFS family permease
LLTGLTIGGILASINAMAAEFSNKKNKNLSVISMASGYPVGVILGGLIASNLLQEYSWRSVFYFGAFATLVFLPLVWLYLPESISFLCSKRPAGALEKVNTILSSMKHQAVEFLPPAAPKKESGFKELIGPTLLPVTIILTISFFLHIMTFYFLLKWIPKVVVDMGFLPAAAGGVLVWTNVGGLAGCLLMGCLSSRFTLSNLVLLMLGASCATVAIFGHVKHDLFHLSVIAAVAGFFLNGGVVGLYALCAQSFPGKVRAGGTGIVIGVGRGGAALSPILAGILFVAGLNLQTVALIMGGGSLAAGIVLFFLRFNRKDFQS